MALCYLKFFALGVTRKTNYLKTILQGRRNRVQDVGRRYEEDAREIVFDIQVVILKRVVLLRVKDFEQGGRRVAAKVSAELVYFIEKDERVDRPCLLHHLNNLTGKRT